MRKGLMIIFCALLTFGLLSCASRKKTSSVITTPTQSASDYLNAYGDLAVREMNRTGVPASITLAQGMLESDYGRSAIAREANNHFGIKCHNGWTGPTITYDDDSRDECFRKYKSPEESFEDHSDFLRSGSRYSFLFALDPTDYKAWAHGLKKAGYATNPDYPNLLIRKIEENGLWQYDRGYKPAVQASAPVSSPKTTTTSSTNGNGKIVSVVNESVAVTARVQRVSLNNNLRYIVVKDGDTREKLEDEFQVLGFELARFNELENDFSVYPGQILYLQPKKESAEQGKEYHTVAEGDTMYLVSQKYGIKLKSLYRMNRMEEGTEPAAGTKLWLRATKPVS